MPSELRKALETGAELERSQRGRERSRCGEERRRAKDSRKEKGDRKETRRRKPSGEREDGTRQMTWRLSGTVPGAGEGQTLG